MNSHFTRLAVLLAASGFVNVAYAQLAAGIAAPSAAPAGMTLAPMPAATALAVLPDSAQGGEAPSAPGSNQDVSSDNSVDSNAKLQSCQMGNFDNDFQALVCEALGARLPVFGSSLFSKAPSTFSPVENVPVAGDYRLQPGDEFELTIWGQVNLQQKLRVDNSGDVFIPQVGKFNVSGIAFGDLEGRINAEVGRNFRNYQLSVTMGRLNQLAVFVTGFAKRPGRYNVSSTSTLLNALFASGGPSQQGTLRRVELKRDGKLVGSFDLYALLLNGDKRADLRLQAGDVIHIPSVGERVAIAGPVKVPAIYELNRNETLSDLMKWAGGLTTTASSLQASLERIVNRENRIVDQVDLKRAAGLNLSDGDIVQIYPMVPRYENMVSIRGSIGLAQRLRWKPGMTVKDLIPSRQMLLTPAYWNRINNAVDARSLGGTNLRYELKNDEATEINWDYAVIERIRPDDFGTELITFNLGKAIAGDAANNLKLQSGDAISIFSKNDVRVPAEKRTRYVRVEGELAVPGVYSVQPGETLRQLLARAGGLSRNAYLYGAVFTRPSIRDEQQKMLNDAVDRYEREVEAAAAAKLADVSLKENVAATQAELQRNRQRVKEMRNVKAPGRVAFEFDSFKVALKNVPDIELEDGDNLFIPRQPATITVFGAVNSPSAYIYSAYKNVGDYVNGAGGYNRLADKEGVYVLRANGTAYGTNSTGWFSTIAGYRPAPGDAIVVPEQLERGLTVTQSLKEWTSILYQFGLGAAGLKVLKD